MTLDEIALNFAKHGANGLKIETHMKYSKEASVKLDEIALNFAKHGPNGLKKETHLKYPKETSVELENTWSICCLSGSSGKYEGIQRTEDRKT